MKKSLKTNSLIIILVVTLLWGAFAAYATKCILICPQCGSMETNHYHPNGGTGAQVKCRDCGYKWFEANPEQESRKVNESEN